MREAVSIVVALHHRLDLLEHQLAAFAADPDARDAELVYVLDGPGVAEPAAVRVPQLEELYRRHVKTVSLSAPAGRAAAFDAGAEQAAGDVLVFMDGGVIPRSPGWLGALAAAGCAAAPALLDEHGVPVEPPPGVEPCLAVPRGAPRSPVRRVDVAVHWLAGADEPTEVPCPTA